MKSTFSKNTHHFEAILFWRMKYAGKSFEKNGIDKKIREQKSSSKQN